MQKIRPPSPPPPGTACGGGCPRALPQHHHTCTACCPAAFPHPLHLSRHSEDFLARAAATRQRTARPEEPAPLDSRSVPENHASGTSGQSSEEEPGEEEPKVEEPGDTPTSPGDTSTSPGTTTAPGPQAPSAVPGPADPLPKVSTTHTKGGQRKAARRAQKKLQEALSGSAEVETTCAICQERFASRTKLFAHIKATGHARLRVAEPTPGGGKQKGRRKKK